MKVRLKDNSIRIRLSMHDVNVLSKQNTLTMRTALTNAQLHYELIPSSKLEVQLHNNTVSVLLPFQEIEKLNDENTTGFEIIVPTKDGNGLQLVVEKDLKCIGRDDAENAGLYPNPKEGTDAC